MLLHTEFKGSPSKFPIDYQSKVLSVGSCFSTHIAELLKKYKFQIFNNPYGTVYNPISIFDSLKFQPADFKGLSLQRDGKWVNYLSHSDISAFTEINLETDLINQSRRVKNFISKASHIILTFGSAKVFELNQPDNRIVANCHKRPSSEFSKRNLSISEIVKAFQKSEALIKEINPGVNYILTVSPVRYLADGLSNSQYEKALLRVACEEINKNYHNVEYFPSYEIMMDDLRDYRFYEADLIHPNRQAIEYIWYAFSQNYLSRESFSLLKKIDSIHKRIEHRPFNPKNSDYKSMLINCLSDIESLSQKVDLSTEMKEIKERLEKLST